MTVRGSFVIAVTMAPDSPAGNWHRSTNDHRIHGTTVNMRNSPMSNESIGQRVRRVRLQKQIGRDAMAQLVKCHPSTITHLEQDKGVGIFVFIEVARMLETSLDYLAYGN